MKVKVLESTNDKLVLDIKGDDHTISNLVKSQVVGSEYVTFAGYDKEHQLRDEIKMVVRTGKGKRPDTVVKSVVDYLVKELTSVKTIK